MRRATVEDAAAIAEVHIASWRATYASLGDAFLASLDVAERADLWTRVMTENVSTTFVAEDSGRVVGFVNLRSSRDEGASPLTGEVVAIYAHPDAWSIGAGRALMDTAVDELRALGFTEAVLWVLDDNERAQRFYERAGWARDGAEKDEVWRGAPIHELRYTRSIPSQ